MLFLKYSITKFQGKIKLGIVFSAEKVKTLSKLIECWINAEINTYIWANCLNKIMDPLCYNFLLLIQCGLTSVLQR